MKYTFPCVSTAAAAGGRRRSREALVYIIQVSLFCAARGEYNLLIYYVGEVPFYFNLDIAGLRVDVIFLASSTIEF